MWRHITHVRHYKQGFAELKQKMGLRRFFWLKYERPRAKARPRPAAGVFQFIEKCALEEGGFSSPRSKQFRNCSAAPAPRFLGDPKTAICMQNCAQKPSTSSSRATLKRGGAGLSCRKQLPPLLRWQGCRWPRSHHIPHRRHSASRRALGADLSRRSLHIRRH